jgi:ferric iron reductase protein FhuF
VRFGALFQIVLNVVEKIQDIFKLCWSNYQWYEIYYYELDFDQILGHTFLKDFHKLFVRPEFHNFFLAEFESMNA